MVLRQFFLVPFAVRSHPHAKPTTSRRHLLMICAALPRRTRLCAAPATHTSSGVTGNVCQARTSRRLRLLQFLIPIRPTLPVRQPLRPRESSQIPKANSWDKVLRASHNVQQENSGVFLGAIRL